MTDTKSLQERLRERLELEPRAAAIMVDLSLLREAVLELDAQAKLIAEAREVLEKVGRFAVDTNSFYLAATIGALLAKLLEPTP